MNDQGQLAVAVITASTRDGRFGPTVTEWFVARASRRLDLALDVVDLAEARLPLDVTDADLPLPSAVTALAVRLAAADAVVVVTPEYNHSFPASLKSAIDWFYDEWAAKPVAFVAYGRESGGLLAVSQLREVFAELQAVTVRAAVIIPNYWEQFTADGCWPKETASCNRDVSPMLDQVVWWGRALRDARARQPYPT